MYQTMAMITLVIQENEKEEMLSTVEQELTTFMLDLVDKRAAF